MVFAAKRIKIWVLAPAIVWCFVILSSCTFSEQANCVSDEDCSGAQRCLRSGGLLIREGVCVDPAGDRELDAGPSDAPVVPQDMDLGGAFDVDAEEEMDGVDDVDAEGDMDVVDDVDASGECPLNETDCQGTCVLLAESIEHCGQCGRACPTGFLCSDGECGCPQDICSGACVELSESLEHCGECNSPCSTQIPDAEVHCSDGQCVVECSESGLTPCDEQGLCADLDSEVENCGACGEQCPDTISGAESVCISGECGYECEVPTHTLCEEDGLCTDLDSDRRHCGACGNRCQIFRQCVDGECAQL